MKNKQTLKWHFILTTFLILIATSVVSALLFYLLSLFQLNQFINRSPWLKVALVFASSTIIGTIISAVISERILTPLHQVIDGTQEVSRGNFNIAVKQSTHRTELTELIENFNRMAAALNRVELMHNDFITNFSHEVRTPLMSIQGFAKQLQNPNLTSVERLEFTDIIISETSRLSHLSANILLLANLENQGNLTIAPAWYALDEQLRKCLLILQRNWEAKGLILALEIEPVQFFGDQEIMASLWLNLLNNSIKFSRPGAHLGVACYTLGNQIKVKIKDHGIGMSDEVRQHVFEKFYQGEESHQGVGSGLGLPIVKKITDLHDGTIHIKSVLGEGSEFTVIFDQRQQKKTDSP